MTKDIVGRLRALLERLRDIAIYAPSDVSNHIIALIALEQEALETLSLPDGVGLTRWDWEFNGMGEDKSGRFVRHEDAAAALAAEKAKTQKIAEGVLSTLRQPRDQSRQDDEYLIEALLRERAEHETALAAEKARGAEAMRAGVLAKIASAQAALHDLGGVAPDMSAALGMLAVDVAALSVQPEETKT